MPRSYVGDLSHSFKAENEFKQHENILNRKHDRLEIYGIGVSMA